MKNQRQNYLLRTHLLRMAMLSQRAVDFAIKAQVLSAFEVYRQFCKYDKEWRSLQRCIGERGRRLYASGMPVDADSTGADAALKIYSALYVSYTAACEIAHIGSRMVERELQTPSGCLGEIASFINRRVRLCTVALFQKDLQHARTILHDHLGWRWCELALSRTHSLLMQKSGEQARYTLAIARALGQIAEQAYEIAQAIPLWLETDKRLAANRCVCPLPALDAMLAKAQALSLTSRNQEGASGR
jgi:phosphate uptake regulator